MEALHYTRRHRIEVLVDDVAGEGMDHIAR